MEKKSQKQIWEKIAKPWSEFRQKPLPEVIDFLKDKKGKILDLGCGSGRHLIAKNDAVFYEVDFSKSMIEYAKKIAEKNKIKAEFSVSSAEKLDFEDDFFDCVIYVAALHCIDSAKARQKSLEELFRVLKKNAKGLVTVWSKQHLRMKNKPKDAVVPWTFEGEKYQRYYYLYEKDELKEDLEKAGFRVSSIVENYKGIFAYIEK